MRGALAACLLGIPLLPLLAVAATPAVAPAGMPADLQRAALELNRLMQLPPASDAPVSLAIRPFRSPSCAVPGSASPGSLSPTPCLSSLELPPVLAQSYFVAYVFALRAQLDPSSDPDLLSALGPDRTVLLNGARSVPLEDGATTACLLARELAALSLRQPQQRQEAFARINAQLAARIRAATGNATSAQGKQDLGLFLMSPLLMTLSKATSPATANGLSATLLRSGHWRLLQDQVPEVAAAVQPLAGVTEELAQRTWRDLDLYFAFALRDRDALLQSQRQEAQVQALARLADAGIDPRACAAVFVPPPSTEALAPAISRYQAAVARRTPPGRPLPSRYQPDSRTVVIVPAAPPRTSAP
jgi:hypothetical protein